MLQGMAGRMARAYLAAWAGWQLKSCLQRAKRALQSSLRATSNAKAASEMSLLKVASDGVHPNRWPERAAALSASFAN